MEWFSALDVARDNKTTDGAVMMVPENLLACS
jgi:hypothetical protein